MRHHIVEDVAICLGEALRKALGDGKGIHGFGYAIVPMDCSLTFSAIDLAKRPFAKIDLKLEGRTIEDMPCEDICHFLEAFTIGKADAALAASVFHYSKYPIPVVKLFLRERGVSVRL